MEFGAAFRFFWSLSHANDNGTTRAVQSTATRRFLRRGLRMILSAPIALLQAVAEMATSKPVIEGLLTVAVGASSFLNKRGERKTRDEITLAITSHAATTESRFDTLDRGINDLRGIVVGPDGKNGLRQRIEEIRGDVKEVRKTCETITIEGARVDERVKSLERERDKE